MVLTKRFLPYPADTSPSVCRQIDRLTFWVLLGTTQKKALVLKPLLLKQKESSTLVKYKISQAAVSYKLN